MNHDIFEETLQFIISIFLFFKQNVPFVLLFNIPILLISLCASFYFKVFQKYLKYSHIITSYYGVTSLFLLWNIYEYLRKNIEIINHKAISSILILVLLIIFSIFSEINKIFEGRKVELDENVSIEKDSNMTIKWNTPNSFFLLKVAISIELVTMLFYAAIPTNSKTRNRLLIEPFLYYTIHFIILAANYLCLFRWKWMQFEWLTYRLRIIEGDANQIQSQKIQVTFYLAIYPASKRFSTELCTICQDLGPNAHFCSYHCFHESCLIPFLIGKTKIILNESQITYVHNEVFENGIREVSRDYMSFEVKVKRHNLPLCPNCKQHFDQNIIEIKLEDHLKNKMVSASVEIID